MTKWERHDAGWYYGPLGGIVKESDGLWHFYSVRLRNYSVPHGKGFEELSEAKKYAAREIDLPLRRGNTKKKTVDVEHSGRIEPGQGQ